MTGVKARRARRPDLRPTMCLTTFPSATRVSAERPAAFPQTQDALLRELADATERVTRFGESLRELADVELNARPGEGRWSAAECLEHLNRYAAHYLPQLEHRARQAAPRRHATYRPGLLGKPFALAMHPARRARTMRSPAAMNPLGSALDAGLVVADFLGYQARYAALVDALRGRELRGSRIPLSLSRLIRFHLGDLLACLVWHHERHGDQAAEALAQTAA